MYNTISQLQRIIVKPKIWLAMPFDGEPGMKLLFCHNDSKELSDFCPIMTARGKVKNYKTIESLLRDAYQVDSDAQVIIMPTSFGRITKRVNAVKPQLLDGFPF